MPIIHVFEQLQYWLLDFVTKYSILTQRYGGQKTRTPYKIWSTENGNVNYIYIEFRTALNN